MLFILILWILVNISSGECPGACSGHGTCGLYDMCTCYKGWMDADCSSRVCQFGFAHVDSPKGDLDSSHSISNPSTIVAKNSFLYSQGTTESYPNMVDTDQNVLDNTAHEYVECSNKGWCDRSTGLCECSLGYSGSACQYSSCPAPAQYGLCYGHGTCESIRRISELADRNDYRLWDKDSTFGCVCDPGYGGYDCSEVQCKTGFDPIYLNIPDSSFRYSNWSYVIYARFPNSTILGNYSLYFYDINDQKWQTNPIRYNATCAEVITSLEGLPNAVIPRGSVRCVKWGNYNAITSADEPTLLSPNPFYGVKYSIAFPRNPGRLRQIEVNRFTTQSTAPSLTSNDATLGWFVYSNGFHGENTDYIRDRCVGVDVTISTATTNGVTYQYLSGMTTMETKLLMRCLGEADGDATVSSSSVKLLGQITNWDFGSVTNPHLIKLVVKTPEPLTDMCGLDNLSGQRGDPSTRLCSYNFPNFDNYTTIMTNIPGNMRAPNASVIRNWFHPGDTPYYGPDRSKFPPSFFAAVIFDPLVSRFKLVNRPGEDYSSTQKFGIFTTKGTLQLVSNITNVYTAPIVPVSKNYHLGMESDGQYSNRVYTANLNASFAQYGGDISCEGNPKGSFTATDCIARNSLVFIMDPFFTSTSYLQNPKYLNMYRVLKAGKRKETPTMLPWNMNPIHLDMGVNSNIPQSYANSRMYVFHPLPKYPDSYTYVSQCSNRGYCNTDTGTCSCFDGFTNDDCSYEFIVPSTTVHSSITL